MVYAIGSRVLITAATPGQRLVDLMDEKGHPSALKVAVDAECEVTAWRPQRTGAARYRIRSTDGIEGWLEASNVRRKPIPQVVRVAVPVATPTPPPKPARKTAAKSAAKPVAKIETPAAAKEAPKPVAAPAKPATKAAATARPRAAAPAAARSAPAAKKTAAKTPPPARKSGAKATSAQRPAKKAVKKK